MSRCVAGIDNCGHLGGGILITGLSGDYYDRCRRAAGHVDGSWLGQWHLPMCGGAFNDAEVWEGAWIPIFEQVKALGENLG